MLGKFWLGLLLLAGDSGDLSDTLSFDGGDDIALLSEL